MIGIGVLVWIVATLLFRFAGQYLLQPSHVALSIGLFVLEIPLLIGLMVALYQWLSIDYQERPRAAMMFALPGMLLDVGSILFFAQTFPNIDPVANVLFAALMLWGYSCVLLSGFLPVVK